MRSLLAYVLAVAAVWPGTAHGQPAPRLERIAQTGRWFVDGQQRVVLLHGGNVSLPGFAPGEVNSGRPAQPWVSSTAASMAKEGFNGVRLVIFLAQLMPQPGKIDEAYLDRIAKAVAAYRQAGIYTLIDFHQDQYGALVGVRGMPEWAVFTGGLKRAPGIDFPMGYFKDPAVQRAFDNFWKNHSVPGTGKGVQDLYVDGLAAVAKRFRDDPAVLGIDVMNEPATGSRCASPDPAVANCPELEQELLKGFYEKASKAIAQAAPRMMIFVEPFMLQGALGIPIRTPLPAPDGRRGLSFHNYGPVKATRDRVNDAALAHVIKSNAAIINTEWGFTNDPAEVSSQAQDFDNRAISWLAWTRGPFEALVDPNLPDRGNGNRVAVLRAYARPYPSATAGTPDKLSFDPKSGTMTYSYSTRLPGGAIAGRHLRTEIRVPAIQYPHGYKLSVSGADRTSPTGSRLLTLRNRQGARQVRVVLSRIGELPPLPASVGEPDKTEAALKALPPIPPGPLSRTSLLGHIFLTPGGREVLQKHLPEVLVGLSHVHGSEKMTLVTIREFAPQVLTEAKLAAIDHDLAQLKAIPGASASTPGALSADSLVSDLLANPRSRAILEREVPGLASWPEQSLFPQTTLRHLQAAIPDRMTAAQLQRVADALSKIR